MVVGMECGFCVCGIDCVLRREKRRGRKKKLGRRKARGGLYMSLSKELSRKKERDSEVR